MYFFGYTFFNLSLDSFFDYPTLFRVGLLNFVGFHKHDKRNVSWALPQCGLNALIFISFSTARFAWCPRIVNRLVGLLPLWPRSTQNLGNSKSITLWNFHYNDFPSFSFTFCKQTLLVKKVTLFLIIFL